MPSMVRSLMRFSSHNGNVMENPATPATTNTHATTSGAVFLVEVIVISVVILGRQWCLARVRTHGTDGCTVEFFNSGCGRHVLSLRSLQCHGLFDQLLLKLLSTGTKLQKVSDHLSRSSACLQLLLGKVYGQGDQLVLSSLRGRCRGTAWPGLFTITITTFCHSSHPLSTRFPEKLIMKASTFGPPGAIFWSPAMRTGGLNFVTPPPYFCFI